jgi:RNA 3'-terminal phosphate cyclase (ATP)
VPQRFTPSGDFQPPERRPLEIDGSHGEGGGQILRTALSVAALTGRTVIFENIRARRRQPGLAAQHLTSVRAAAAICAARLEGDALGGQALLFAPQRTAQSGRYSFDVAAAREGGSAGAASLVLQTVLLPLAFATTESNVVVEGGTHNPMSPPFDYLRDVWLKALVTMGVRAEIALERWGWYPVGQGRLRALIAAPPRKTFRLKAFNLLERGALLRVEGRAAAANLPSHIPERMALRARTLLTPLGVDVRINAERVEAACPGAGIFLTAIYEHASAGFSALGRPGRRSEEVAEEAALSLAAYHAANAALDAQLGDQILLPAALAESPSRFSVHRVTRHLRTNAWVIEEFGLAKVEISERPDGTVEVSVVPLGA